MAERILYRAWDEPSQRSTTITLDSETGLPLIELSQNVRPILEANKRQAASFDRNNRNRDGFTHIARIPRVIYQQLQKLGITRDPKAMNRWLQDADNAVFRVDDRRRI